MTTKAKQQDQKDTGKPVFSVLANVHGNFRVLAVYSTQADADTLASQIRNKEYITSVSVGQVGLDPNYVPLWSTGYAAGTIG